MIAAASAFLAGGKYEGWKLILATFGNDDGHLAAVLVQAPDEVETANPYVFLYPVEGGETIVIASGDLFLLAIAVANRWATTSDLEALDESVLAELLATVSFYRVHPDATPRLVQVLNQAALNIISQHEGLTPQTV